VRPNLVVVITSSGFTGEGVEAVTPKEATAKLSCWIYMKEEFLNVMPAGG
jgi:hypothetical protein